MAPAQQDGGLGGCRARRLQEHLEAAGLRPVQVVIENELAGAEHSQQRCHRAWAARAAPCDSHPLTEQLWGAEAWNSGLERTAGALGSDTDARKEPGEMALSDLSEFVTKAVDDLVNYYLKSETFTKEEILSLVATIQGVSFVSVAVRPEASSGPLRPSLPLSAAYVLP